MHLFLRKMTLHLHLAAMALKRKPLARGTRVLRTLSIADGFCRLPSLEYADGSVAPDVCHLAFAAAGAPRSARHGDAQSDNRHATTRDGPADVNTAEKWPRSGERALRRHGGRSNSRVQ